MIWLRSLKGVMPDKADDLTIQAKFFLDFAQNTMFRRFTFFEESRHDAEPFLRPAFVAGQNDFAFVLDDGRHNRDRIIPVNEIAGWALLAFVCLRFLQSANFVGTFRAEFV